MFSQKYLKWVLYISIYVQSYAHLIQKTTHFEVEIQNSSHSPKNLYLISDQFILENVDFYYQEDSVWRKASSGWGRPLGERMVPSYLHVFRMEVPAQSKKTVYFNVRNRYQVNKLPLKIMDETQFRAYHHKVLLMDGMVLLALFTSICFSIYNLIFSRRYRKMLWFYLAYASSFLIFYGLRVVAPNFVSNPIPVNWNYWVLVPIFISTYTFLRFAVAFVNVESVKEHTLIQRVITGLFIAAVLVTLIPSWAWHPIVFGIQLTFFVVTIVYHAYYLLLSFRRNKLAKIYIIMALPLVLSGLLEGLTNTFGVIDVPSELFDAFRVSIVLEMLFILFALIYRDRYLSRLLRQKLEHTELQLANAQIEIQESEQERLAQDLHDDLGGTLATFKRFVFDKILPLKEKEDEEQLKFLAQKAASDLRRISHALMPPDFKRNGLIDSVRELAEQNSGPGRTIAVKIYGDRREVPSDTALHIYRILSEVIQNINKHSRATEVLIQFFWNEKDLTITVEDDGSEFSDTEEGLGMKNMKMRAKYLRGEISFDSNANGSTIILEIPLN